MLNSFTGKSERIGRMVEMHADDARWSSSSAQAGDIVAYCRHEKCPRPVTRCATPSSPATLEAMVFPEPVISSRRCAHETRAGAEKMGIATRLRWLPEDPSFRVETDEDSGETIHERHGGAAPGR